MIHYEGQLTPQQYRRAFGAATGISAIGMIMVCGGALAVLTGSGNVVLLLILFGLLLLLWPWLAVRRAFLTSKVLREPFTGDADEELLVVRSANSEARLTWDKFYRAVVKPDVVLLYLSSQLFYMTPRAFFASDADWDAFRELVKRKVSRRGVPVWAVFLIWLAMVVVTFIVFQLTHS